MQKTVLASLLFTAQPRKVTRLLVNSGARTDATQRSGVMPIHLAAQGNRHQMLTYLVMEAGVSVDLVSLITNPFNSTEFVPGYFEAHGITLVISLVRVREAHK